MGYVIGVVIGLMIAFMLVTAISLFVVLISPLLLLFGLIGVLIFWKKEGDIWCIISLYSLSWGFPCIFLFPAFLDSFVMQSTEPSGYWPLVAILGWPTSGFLAWALMAMRDRDRKERQAAEEAERQRRQEERQRQQEAEEAEQKYMRALQGTKDRLPPLINKMDQASRAMGAYFHAPNYVRFWDTVEEYARTHTHARKTLRSNFNDDEWQIMRRLHSPRVSAIQKKVWALIDQAHSDPNFALIYEGRRNTAIMKSAMREIETKIDFLGGIIRAESSATRETIEAEGAATRETIEEEGAATRETIEEEERASRKAIEKEGKARQGRRR